MSGSIIVIHTAIEGMPISNAAIREALGAPDTVGNEVTVRIQPCELPLGSFDNVPWDVLAAEQNRHFQKWLAPPMREHPDWSLVYFGLVPIPLAIHLGALVGQKPRVLARLHHHDDRTWRWPRADASAYLLQPWEPPPFEPEFDGELSLRVQTSYRIDPKLTRRALTTPYREVEVSVSRPHPDVLQSPQDLEVLARRYKQALDDSCGAYPGAKVRNVFASVPVGLAFRMGTAINPTIHTPIQTWQYMSGNTAPYQRALLIGEPMRPSRVLVLGASPPNAEDISAAAEVEEIAEILQRPSTGEPVEVMSDSRAALEGLFARLHEVKPSFVHIASHGRAPGHKSHAFRDLALDGDDGAMILHSAGAPSRSRDAEIRDLVRFLDALPCVRVAVATACHSDELAMMLQRPDRVAIGFRGKLEDGAARSFSRAFWSSLMRPGCSIADAFHVGCVEMGRPTRESALLLPEGAGKNIYLVR